MKISLKQLRKLIRESSAMKKMVTTRVSEEIGRNVHTINTSPYTFEDFKDYNIEIDGSTEGGFFLTIFFQNEKMIPSTRFNSYDDAHHHARMVIDKDRVTRMNS
jgi:hypothetical protein